MALLVFWSGSAAAITDEGWRLRLIPYIWFAGLDGKIGTIPGLPPVEVDVSPSEAIEDTEVSLMVRLDAKKRRHGFILDVIYTDVRADGEIAPQLGLKLRAVSKTTMISAAYTWEFYQEDGAEFDLMVGARYWHIDPDLRFTGRPGGLLDGRNINNKESWTDPTVAVRAMVPIGESRFVLAGGVGVGGFDVGSELSYEGTASLGYMWSDSITTVVGYRMFDVDYEDDGWIFDVTQQGWHVGLAWTF